jgi:SAM-dependent methyltransferase
VARRGLGVFLRQREALLRSLKPAGRLLDFGCGNGAFAQWMSRSGYDVVGLEPFSLGKTVSRDHLTLMQAPLEQVEQELGTFDIITLWHVLEHLTQPVEVLARLGRHLNPDGVLVISVPNFQSWQRALFRGGWFHLDPPRHLLHFEPATLSDCLGRAGFSQVGQHPFLPEYGSSGWVQSVLNACLPRTNYLYELVKDRGALKGMSAASSAVHFTASMIAGLPVLALSLPVEAAASLGNRCAALTVVAKKAH